MQRPVLKWLLFASCLAVFLAVMAWITARTLDMERQRVAAERNAQVQERIRLALWRMDSLASTLLIRENSRPPGDYQAFRSPDDLFTRDNQEVPRGKTLMPSPLLGEPPEFVLLHFEALPPSASAMGIGSPQVPMGSQLELANNWYAISPQLQHATERLGKLNALLKRHPELMGRASVQSRTRAEGTKDTAPAPAKPVAMAPADTQAASNVRELAQRSNVVQQQIANEKAQSNKGLMKKSEGSLQLYADSLGKKADARASRSAAPATVVPSTPAASAESAALALSAATTKSERPEPMIADDTASMATASAKSVPLESRAIETKAKSATALSPVAPTFAQQPAPLQTQSGDLLPVWAENELLLVRTATLDGKTRQQGVWVDWEKLRGKLLEVARDLLPQAALFPALPDAARLDPSSLVTLPVKLAAGAVALPMTDGWSPLQRSLSLAWLCLAAAAIAIALVLHRAMLLSERRGAFVSAVTHELRTPLTTFQLYSEMLAGDMVPDPARRKEYLRTLCDESTRLTHLVENVLAYSRIERGRTAARVERATISALIARIEPRLQSRCEEVDLALETALPEAVATLTMKVDAMGLEQILFNLVDNACKYAAAKSEPRTLDLDITAQSDHIIFRVRDHGPGISKQQMKRLFQPFEKSAIDAAHTAPGVGLGLALCRRLAREMGGDLTLENAASTKVGQSARLPAEGRCKPSACTTFGGACFTLRLPQT